jgi:capsid protein
VPADHQRQPRDEFEADGPRRAEPDELLARLADPMYRAWLEEALGGVTFPADDGDIPEGEEGAA